MCVATWFPKRRSLALTLVTCGASTGGIVFPVIAQQMLPKAGLAWTLRCMALVVLVDGVVIIALARDRLSPRPPAPFLELSAFKELPYTLFSVGVFFCSWALYVAYDYVGSHLCFESQGMLIRLDRSPTTPFLSSASTAVCR